MISQIVAPPPPPPPSLRQPQMFGMRMVSSREPMQQQHQPFSIINSNHPTYHKYHQPFLVQHQQPQINLMNTNSSNTSSSLSSDFLSIKSASTSVPSSLSSSPNLIKSVSNPSPTARNAIRMSPSMRLQTMTWRNVTNASKTSTVTNSTANAQAPLSTKQKPEPIYSLVNQAPVRKNTAYEARLKLNTLNRLGSSV
jgi:hypothetical protein